MVTERGCDDMDRMPYLSLKCQNIEATHLNDSNDSMYQSKSSPYLLFGRHGIYDNSGHVIRLNHSR